MKKYIVSIILVISLIGTTNSLGQQNIQTASQLAFKYFRDKEYKPASVLFHDLFTSTQSKTYFNYYIDCLLHLKNYQDAEKFIKKQIKKHPGDNNFQIALGYAYKQAGDIDDSKNQYNKVIQKLIPVKSAITSTANSFLGKREYELAGKTYLSGRKLINQEDAFHYEIANIFYYQKDYKNMVKEYLMALAIDESKLNLIENRLQSALFQDIDSSLGSILKNQLLEKIQKSRNNIRFKELLLWYFMQKKQFSAALDQAMSIDLIQNEDGSRLLELAKLASSNKDYKTALRCYQIVINKGNKSPQYFNAKIGILDTHYFQLKDNNSDSLEEWQTLSNQYEEFFNQQEMIAKAPLALIKFAHIKAFYLKNNNKAIELLQKALSTKNLNTKNRSNIKMELADVKLFNDEKWDAILLYAQIEKSNKNNPLGFEAKFKKAKASYYMGELNWAKAQLDAIKGSTSKLIANDAIALSQLISDNTTLDTTETALKTYAEAEFLSYKKQDSSALQTLDLLIKNHPDHSLTDEAYYKKAEIYLSEKKIEKAIYNLNLIVNKYPYNSLADKALFQLGTVYEKQSQKEKAINSYKLVLTKYPDSIFSIEARDRLHKLQR
ncbi:tetratricopeptide repeat protein [Ancylomarina longa]|uniref:Outer membrane protein assembly factor BamD n=1 Tax=Ancylomarina longa TaxID=2487017 RepID=A0A434AXI9_9BACT|nr:tetratricopeptide repeat protein [Ancylomarina longa]RUT79275.1 hypothetical protein DLK05_03365 [Ancylomarina longa]